MAWNEADKKDSATRPTTIPAGMNHVCICVPHWGQVQLEWVESTYGPLKFIPQADFTKSFKLSRGILNIDTHRNMLVQMALEDKSVTHIFFLDSDSLCESPNDPNQALRYLLACNTPIVSGLYRAKHSKGSYPYAMWMKNPNGVGYIVIENWTGNFIKADVVGFGAILLKREVFEKVPYPWFEWKEKSPSEDFWACEKFAQYGYEVKVFTECKFSHVGTMKVKIGGEIHMLDV